MTETQRNTLPPISHGSVISDRYEIRQSLGKGGMGEVFLAYDRATQQPVALKIVREVESAFYLHLEVDDEPGVLARVAAALGDQSVSVKSVVQKGMGAQARLVMVLHRAPETRFLAAVEAGAPVQPASGRLTPPG